MCCQGLQKLFYFVKHFICIFYKQKTVPFNLEMTADRMATLFALYCRLFTSLPTKALVRICMCMLVGIFTYHLFVYREFFAQLFR